MDFKFLTKILYKMWYLNKKFGDKPFNLIFAKC
jgi:hypothetical protein